MIEDKMELLEPLTSLIMNRMLSGAPLDGIMVTGMEIAITDIVCGTVSLEVYLHAQGMGRVIRVTSISNMHAGDTLTIDKIHQALVVNVHQ